MAGTPKMTAEGKANRRFHYGGVSHMASGAVPFACGLLALALALYANVCSRWLMMIHSSWRDSVNVSSGWPFTFRCEMLVLNAGSSAWQSMSSETSPLALVANVVVAVGAVFGIAILADAVVRILSQWRFLTRGAIALTLLSACMVGYVRAEASLVDINLFGRWAVAPTFFFPGYLCWLLRFAIACSMFCAIVIVLSLAHRRPLALLVRPAGRT
jgi:hypothetical protein